MSDVAATGVVEVAMDLDREYLCARMARADRNMLRCLAAENVVMAAYWGELAEGWAVWIRHFDRRGWR